MWVRIDDGMHNHRKTRAVTKSHATKSRDAAPLGVWVLAASWAGQNGTDGWVPEDELDRWDSEWKPLVSRLVSAGYWWPHVRDGERGFGFNDWHDYNDPADAASKAGTYGNHVRWHVNEGKVEPECQHCPKEPVEPEDRGDVGGRSGGDSHPTSGGESGQASGAIALPEPEPLPDPNPNPGTTLAEESADPDPLLRFAEFWDTYGHKVKRPDAEKKWCLALKKPGVTPDLLIAAAAAYVAWERANNEGGKFIAHPSTWLHGERWRDERKAVQSVTRVGAHLQLARELAGEQTILEIGHRQ